MAETRKNPESQIYSGKQYEYSILGELRFNDPEYKIALEKVKEPSTNPALEYYVNFFNSIELAKNFQPINKETGEPIEPDDPKKPVMRDIKEEVGDLLAGLNIPDTNIKVYTAVNSPLDECHGTDFFFEINGKIITIDITLKNEKKTAKADVVDYTEIPEPAFDEDGYMDRIEKIAKQVVDIYKIKIESKKQNRRPSKPTTWTAPGFEDRFKDAG